MMSSVAGNRSFREVSAAAMLDTGVILKRFESPDETRRLERGKFELVHIGGMTIGRATYQPGWKWSEHVGKALGQSRCMVAHVGMVLAGTGTAASTTAASSSCAPANSSSSPRCRTTAGGGRCGLRVAAFQRRAALRKRARTARPPPGRRSRESRMLWLLPVAKISG